MSARRRAAAAALLALAASGCQITSNGWVNDPTRPGPSIAIVGDSLISDDVADWAVGPLGQNGPLAVWAMPGSKYEHSDPDRATCAYHGHHDCGFIEQLQPVPEVFVIAQGANNASPFTGDADGWTPADEAELSQLIFDARRDSEASPGRSERIVLLTVAVAPDAAANIRTEVGQLNAHVRARAASSPSVFVLADFAAAVNRVPAGERPGLFRDFVHHTPAGAALYRATIEQAVGRAVASLPA